MQMPRWLFDDQNYNTLSLSAKVAYTFLFNRCQLSQHNGWTNQEEEVYIIFTREELAEKMQISYKKAISCFAELQSAGLICEERRGRGMPNRIYLAQVECAPATELSATESACVSEPDDRSNAANHSDNSLINCQADAAETETVYTQLSISQTESAAHSFREVQKEEPIAGTNGKVAALDEPVLHDQTDISRPVDFTVQDLSFSRADNDSNTNDTTSLSVEKEKSVCQKREGTDSIILKDLLDNCDLELLPFEERHLIRDAVTWLFYADGLKMGTTRYPQAYVRSRLSQMHYEVLRSALFRFTENRTRIRGNALCYAAKILFSCLTESRAKAVLSRRISPGISS